MRKGGQAEAWSPVLQILNGQKYSQHHEATAECSPNNGAIACSIRQEEQFHIVLYTEHHIGDSGIVLRFRTVI